MEEQTLISNCLKGDNLSQRLLYDKYSGQMYSICLRYCSDDHQAQDALQNGFIRVFRNLNKYRFDGPLGAWIRKIIIRSAIDQIGLNKKYQSLFTDVELDSITDQGVEWSDDMTYNQILKLVDNLPPGYKMVFTMYVLDDMSHAEIAEILHITESTSRSQLKKARSLIKKQMLEKNYII